MLADIDLIPITVTSYSLDSSVDGPGEQGPQNVPTNSFSRSSQMHNNPTSPLSLTSDSPIPTFTLSTGPSTTSELSFSDGGRDGDLGLEVGVTVETLGLTNLDSYCIYQSGDLEYEVAPQSATRSINVDTGGNMHPPDLPDTKEGIEELCPVCGDKVSGYHYGLLTCESCKGFFKRTVQNKKVYTCVADRSCHIDKSQRKRCPFCRFQKCLEVGMKLEAVRADRMRGGRNKFGPMYKRDRARKMQIVREKQVRAPGDASATPKNGVIYPGGHLISEIGEFALTFSPTTGTYQRTIKHDIQIPQISSLTTIPDTASSSQAKPSLNLGSTQPEKTWNYQETRSSVPRAISPKAFQFETLLNSESSSTQNPVSQPSAKLPLVFSELLQSLNDKEWQSALFGLLQNQTYNQCEVDLFELLCKVLDQSLFTQVDWARNSIFFKDLKVDDQMKLLQYSWSDLLVLDHIHQRMHNSLPEETALANGQKFNLLSLAILGSQSLTDALHALTSKLNELSFDLYDYVCLKFLILLNPDARGISNRHLVSEAHDQIRQALFDYCINFYSNTADKFSKLLGLISDLRAISSRGEDFLYLKHLNGCAPTQTLLMEMLHAKRR
ncbi:nuclear hormone receptor FTZ-F1-like [Artemia franciscana]|uniref:nuclear hormone receptor FTZ-F1-like n=1 Tax=Artemia franciscana TaxID=6661 RepID=UPI0032DA3B54